MEKQVTRLLHLKVGGGGNGRTTIRGSEWSAEFAIKTTGKILLCWERAANQT